MGIFVDEGKGPSLESGRSGNGTCQGEQRCFSVDLQKVNLEERNFPHLKITISQINLELAQHTKYLTVFKSKSLAALTITYSFSMVL